MYEKVNPAHPDKIADRIAGAVVDLAYQAEENPKIAVEVLMGMACAMLLLKPPQNLTQQQYVGLYIGLRAPTLW